MTKFLRTDWMRHSRLGKNRKKIQRWRSATGRHNKIRKRREGYPSKPLIGYKKSWKESGRILGLLPVMVNSVKDLSKIKKDNIAIISRRLGAKKKIEVISKAQEMKIKIANLGVNKNENK